MGILHSNNKGVTQVQFSLDGNRIYSGSRMDDNIICWDVRYTARDLFHLPRKVETNQRIHFDIGSRSCLKRDCASEEILVSGNTNGNVMFWDISQDLNRESNNGRPTTDSFEIESCFTYQAHKDCVNGVSIHPFLPVLATSSGQRHYTSYSYDCSDSDTSEIEIEENCLKFWKIENWKI